MCVLCASQLCEAKSSCRACCANRPEQALGRHRWAVQRTTQVMFVCARKRVAWIRCAQAQENQGAANSGLQHVPCSRHRYTHSLIRRTTLRLKRD